MFLPFNVDEELLEQLSGDGCHSGVYLCKDVDRLALGLLEELRDVSW